MASRIIGAHEVIREYMDEQIELREKDLAEYNERIIGLEDIASKLENDLLAIRQARHALFGDQD